MTTALQRDEQNQALNDYHDEFDPEKPKRRLSSLVDISQNYSLGPPTIPGRPSHTSNMSEFDNFIREMREYERAETDAPFNEEFWDAIRSRLVPLEKKVIGYDEVDDPTQTIPAGPKQISNLIDRVVSMSSVNPIHPVRLAEGLSDDITSETVLRELMYATKVGLLTMQWSPECVQCGSAVIIKSNLGHIPQKAHCNGCHKENHISSLDNIMVTFYFSPSVLYVLADNFACTLSKKSAEQNVVFAPMPGTNTGSGFRYSVGCGAKELQIGDALPKGKYRMHCPVAMTDTYLQIEDDAGESDQPLELQLKVSDMKVLDPQEKLKTITVPHGKIHFDILPDTRSFFVLWIQNTFPNSKENGKNGEQVLLITPKDQHDDNGNETEDEILLHLPKDERSEYTTASEIINHGSFHLFHDQVVPQTPKALSIEQVVIVFTDIVGSTDLYASLGDGAALQLVRQHFEVLFSAFASRGRVVKTVGDCVMASFTSGKLAIEAVAEAFRNVAEFCAHPITGRPLEIRVGLHEGSAVVVPVNKVNDYFGQTINIAARLEGAARASECVISTDVLKHSEARQAYQEVCSIDNGQTFIAIPKARLTLKGVKNPVSICGFRLVGCKMARRQSDLRFMNTAKTLQEFNLSSHSSMSEVDDNSNPNSSKAKIPRALSRSDLADRHFLNDESISEHPNKPDGDSSSSSSDAPSDDSFDNF